MEIAQRTEWRLRPRSRRADSAEEMPRRDTEASIGWKRTPVVLMRMTWTWCDKSGKSCVSWGGRGEWRHGGEVTGGR